MVVDFIVKDLDSNYRLDAFRNKADKIIFEISSAISTANCPYCGKESKRIHSRYQREVQDLPIQGKKVVLLVLTVLLRVRFGEVKVVVLTFVF